MAIDFEGLEVLVDRLEKLTNPQHMEAAIKQATLFVEGEARKNAASISKGELPNSISSRIEGLTGEIFTPLYYAPYVEFGTGLFAEGKGGGRKEVPWVYVEGQFNETPKKTIHTKESAKQAVAFLQEKGLEARMTYGQHPQPFMRPALDNNREAITQLLGEGIVKND